MSGSRFLERNFREFVPCFGKALPFTQTAEFEDTDMDTSLTTSHAQSVISSCMMTDHSVDKVKPSLTTRRLVIGQPTD